MKNYADQNQPVTKREFQAHTKDFQELKQNFHEFVKFTAKTVATKDDLKEFADKAFKTFATKEDVRCIVEKSEGRIMKKMDTVIVGNDHIAKELKPIRIEQAATAAADREQNDRLDVIEDRLGIQPVAA